MERRYHTCGCPINVWHACQQRNGEPTFFDGRTSWTDRAIHTCPCCGARLRLAALQRTPPVPTGTLAAYLLTWPDVRQRLEHAIQERRWHDPAFAADAQHALDALERALNRVADVAARLDEPAPDRSAAAPHRRGTQP